MTISYKIKSVTVGSTSYPQKFLQIKDSPNDFYLLGREELLQERIVGVVGPRNPSVYVKRIAEEFMDYCRNYSLVTVSGGAEGVDTICHNRSFNGNIPTIVVLGCGIEYALRSSKRGFLEKVIKKEGLIISQFSGNTKPARWTYPKRNILISALADILFIPGGSEGSGTMITARNAFEQGIPVFSVPGSLYERNSSGTNRGIIENKIIPINDFATALKQGGFKKNNGLVQQGRLLNSLNDEEMQLLALCENTIELGLLLSKTKRPIGKLLSIIGVLEGEKLIYQPSPGEYVKKQ